jgi:hypothetical protein
LRLSVKIGLALEDRQLDGTIEKRTPTALVRALRFAPNGKSAATIGDRWVRFRDVATTPETRRFTLPKTSPSDASWVVTGVAASAIQWQDSRRDVQDKPSSSS